MARFRGIDPQGRHGQIGLIVFVEIDQRVVVHLIDVIAGQDHDILGPLLFQGIDILIDGVGRALIPMLVDALLRRDDIDEFAQFAAKEMPPADIDMPIEAHGFVLRQHQHLPQPAVEAVRQRKVDDAISSPERHSRLGSIARQRLQSRAFAASQHYRQDIHHVASPSSQVASLCQGAHRAGSTSRSARTCRDGWPRGREYFIPSTPLAQWL